MNTLESSVLNWTLIPYIILGFVWWVLCITPVRNSYLTKDFGKWLQANQLRIARFPDFSFNVSHHGDYVVIVSDPVSPVGVDIITHDKHFGLHPKKLFALHVTSFTSFEWETIHSGGPDSRGMLDQFYRLVF